MSYAFPYNEIKISNRGLANQDWMISTTGYLVDDPTQIKRSMQYYSDGYFHPGLPPYDPCANLSSKVHSINWNFDIS
jgi:hypothetical protein